MRFVIVMITAAALVSGCSTRPREFRPTLASPAADEGKYAETLLQCQVMVRQGVKGNFATTLAQLGVGSAGGMAAGLAVASAFTGATSTGFVNSAAIGAGSSALVVAGPLVGFGVSRLIRTSREKKYKGALGTCLTEFGYTATSWEKQHKLSKVQVKAVLDKWKSGQSTPDSQTAITAPKTPSN